ncbi:MAG: hypothetical protein JWQ98_3318 [Chlorobi bacterium]|nr:hypothetical protein [Chlorobiota bacterium]
MKTAPKTIDEYTAGFPEEIRNILEEIRMTIRKAAPDAEETIKYQMPTFTLNGNLIHFAAFKKHIVMYPVPRDVDTFKDELSACEGEKNTVRFPFNKPVPFDLIGRIIEFRAKRNLEKSAVIEEK